jgi:hypothetical protein
MANAFQDMLERFGLTEKILAVNADNATSNDTQTTKLDKLDNSFNKENRVRCFNHIIQLSAKALLKPFNTALSGKDGGDEMPTQDENDESNPQVILEDEGEDEDGEEEADIEDDVEDDDVDELQELSEEERTRVLEETAVVRETVTKVCTR